MNKRYFGYLTALVFFCIQATAFGAGVKTVKFAGQWPFHPTKMIAVDPNSGTVFTGNGDTLLILDSHLNLFNSIRVTDTGEITSLFYDPNHPDDVFVTCKNDGFRVINVDNVAEGANPVISGIYRPNGTGELNGVFVSGNYAYLAGHLAITNDDNTQEIADLQIIDLTESTLTPTLSVRLLGAYGLTYGVDIAVADTGDYAYISDLYNGIHVIDLSDLADTTKQRDKRLMILAGARDLSLADNYLYAGIEGAGMMIIDVTDPLEPKAAGYDPDNPDVVTGVYTPDHTIRAVRINGDTAFLAESAGGLEAIDISDKSTPVPFEPPVVYTDTGARSIGLYPQGDAAFITDYTIGLEKIDTSVPGTFTRTASYDLPGDAIALDLLNGYAYVIDDTVGDAPSEEGLRILSVKLSNGVVILQLSGFCATPGTASDVVATDSAVYIADGNSGLQIIDTSDKTAPLKAGAIATGGFAAGIAVSGNYAYIADRTAGLVIVDISDKGNPAEASTLSLPGSAIASHIAVNGDHAWVAARDAGLISVDISDPDVPKIDAILDTAGTGNAIAIDALLNLAFVADGTNGMVIVDIANPSAPVIKPVIIDNSNPETPVYANHLDLGADALNVILAGAFVYFSTGEDGIVTVDATNPDQPFIDTSWSYDTAGNCRDTAFYAPEDEIYILAADAGAGVVAINPTYDTSQATSTSTSSSAGCFITTLR